jgi:hypothetical protein
VGPQAVRSAALAPMCPPAEARLTKCRAKRISLPDGMQTN